jgi:hypothetical protein
MPLAENFSESFFFKAILGFELRSLWVGTLSLKPHLQPESLKEYHISDAGNSTNLKQDKQK